MLSDEEDREAYLQGDEEELPFGPMAGSDALASESEQEESEEDVAPVESSVGTADRSMVKRLQSAATADVQKGKDIRKQLVRCRAVDLILR